MKDRKTFKLIEGVFTAQDAQLLVLIFYNEKIMFHNRELLAMKIKNDHRTERVEEKIDSLMNARDKFIEYLRSFSTEGTLFDINGSIDIVPVGT